MTKNLKEIKWKEFKVKNIFSEIEKCKCNNVSIFKQGDIPYIGATSRNNGTIKYIKAPDKYITKGNCIVFICDGQGSVGYSIYKSENFVGSTTLKVGRNKYLNRYNAHFIVSALDKNRNIYSYGYKRTEARLKNETIYLPVNSKGEPDYKYMEDYIKKCEEKLKKQYKEQIANRIKAQHKPYNKKDWKEFKITEIFSSIQRGKRQKSEDRIMGNTPYYSASIDNNGLTDFISNPSFTYTKNAIIYSTFADAYYAPKNFSTSDEITILYSQFLNRYNSLFIVCALQQNKSKYSFGRKAFSNKITKDKIMLPVNSKGEPDYKYMEDYMKYLEQKKLLEYLEYIK